MIVVMQISGPIADGILPVPAGYPFAGQKFLEVDVNFSGTIKQLKEAICEELPGDSVEPDGINLIYRGRIIPFPDTAILNDHGLNGNLNWSNIVITGKTAHGGGKGGVREKK